MTPNSNKKRFMQNKYRIMRNNSSFTLIELLITIGVLATLSSVTVSVLNPVNMLNQSKDSKRMQDVSFINKSIQLAQSLDPDISIGTSSVVYISLPDTSSSCSNLGLPALSNGWVYHCVTEDNLHKTDGNGWLPINFQNSNVSPVVQLSSLPIDPINSSSTGLYYIYAYMQDVGYEIDAQLRSDKYLSVAQKDGGDNDLAFEKGSNLRALYNCGVKVTDSRDGKVYNIIQLGTRCWLDKNMNVGTMIASTTEASDNGVIEKYCYDDNESICSTDGGIYDWDEAMQYASGCNGSGESSPECSSPVQGVCPSGWHIPSHYELMQLDRSVCTSGSCATDFPFDTTTIGWRGSDEGTKLKTGGASGFDVVLSGYRVQDGTGVMIYRGSIGFIWSSTDSGSNAWYRYFQSTHSDISRYYREKTFGFSVRCVKG